MCCIGLSTGNVLVAWLGQVQQAGIVAIAWAILAIALGMLKGDPK